MYFTFLIRFIPEVKSVAQSCPTLCDPTDYTVHGVLQARILPSLGNLSNLGSNPCLLRWGLFTSWAKFIPKVFCFDHDLIEM